MGRAKWGCQLSLNPALPSIFVQTDASSSSGSQRMNPLVLGPTEPSVPNLGKFTLVFSHQEFRVTICHNFPSLSQFMPVVPFSLSAVI